MKPLSESLEELSARVKVLEDSATATFEADRAKLEQRRNEIDEAFTSDVNEFESAIRDAGRRRPHVVERDQGGDEAPGRRGPGPQSTSASPSTSCIGRSARPTPPRKMPQLRSRSRSTS